MKLSNHNVRSPMENINNACQTCHNVSEDELRARVEGIQDRTVRLQERAAEAMTDMLDAILEAQESARILAESIDYNRQAQARASSLRAPEAPSTQDIPKEPVRGLTPEEEAPIEE